MKYISVVLLAVCCVYFAMGQAFVLVEQGVAHPLVVEGGAVVPVAEGGAVEPKIETHVEIRSQSTRRNK